MSVEDIIKSVSATDDFYELLGVSKEADEAELTKAYRKLALKLHPDKCQLEGGETAFKKVSNAFSVLKDPEQRAHYDRFGSQGPVGHSGGGPGGNPFGGAGGVDLDELFREMFRNHPDFQGVGGGGGGGTRRQRRAGGMPGGVPGGGMPFMFHTTGMPGGMQFNFGGPSNGGGGGGRGGGPAFALPEPIKTIVGLVPPPFLALGAMLLFVYSISFIVSTLWRNIHIVIFMNFVPIPPQMSRYLWLAFFAAGLFGYI